MWFAVAADLNLLKIPADLPDNKALFLSDILATAWFATELANVSEGDTVAIWGAGPGDCCHAKHVVFSTQHLFASSVMLALRWHRSCKLRFAKSAGAKVTVMLLCQHMFAPVATQVEYCIVLDWTVPCLLHISAEVQHSFECKVCMTLCVVTSIANCTGCSNGISCLYCSCQGNWPDLLCVAVPSG